MSVDFNVERSKKYIFKTRLDDFQNVISIPDYSLLNRFVNSLSTIHPKSELRVDYEKNNGGDVRWYRVDIGGGKSIEYVKQNHHTYTGLSLADDLLLFRHKERYVILAKRSEGSVEWNKLVDENDLNLITRQSQKQTKDSTSAIDYVREHESKLSDIKHELDKDLVSLLEKMFSCRSGDVNHICKFNINHIKRNNSGQIEYLHLTDQDSEGNQIVLLYLKQGCSIDEMNGVGVREWGVLEGGVVSNDVLLQQQDDDNNRWYKIIAKKTLNGYWQVL